MTPQKRAESTLRRWLLITLIALPLVILLVLAAGIWWLMQADLRPLAERYASRALGREVHASRLEIGWGDPLRLTLRDLRIANAPWGSEPDMISLTTLDAVIDLHSLWDGTPIYRHLRAEGLKVVLERDDQGIGNWKFGGDAGAHSDTGPAIIPKNRTQFPTLIHMALTDALITYRTYSGSILRIKLDEVAIAAPDEETPVMLEAKGAYNDTPLALSAKTGTFGELRDAALPFPADFTLSGRTAQIDFTGTMMEPLDFEGVDGRMKLAAQELDNLAASFGADIVAPYPLLLSGDLTRKGDHWELNRAAGEIAAMPFKGALVLDEGRHGGADHVAVDLDFKSLDLDKLLPPAAAEKNTDWRTMALSVPKGAGMTLHAKLAAGQLAYRGVKLADFSGRGQLQPEAITLEEVTGGIGGGTISLSARLQPAHLVADAAAQAIDADRLAQEWGAPAGDLAGQLDAALRLDLSGATLEEGLAQGQGILVAGMTGGSVREKLIEQASTDLRALFRDEAGSAPLHCLGLRATLAGGRIQLSPLRLQAEGATLEGAGSIDTQTLALDLRVESRRESSGFFALDLPIQVGGTLESPKAGLAEKGAKLPATPSRDDTMLTAGMRELMGRNACLH